VLAHLACAAWLSFACAAAQGRDYAVASAHPLATAAGYEMLERGGNAFDAAVAVAATLAVVEPYASGLGGGGLWLLHRARDGHEAMVDARETAPAAASPALYLGPDGAPIHEATRRGGLAAAIPGTPAALAHVAQRYGTLPLSATLAPAIRHAREGFPVGARYAQVAALRERWLREGVGTAAIFLDGGRAPRPDWVLRQPELAATLERIAAHGREGFYAGAVARALVETVRRAGGVWTLADLASYRVVERAPLRVRYRGARITTATLPSAGGLALVQSLQMLERFPAGDGREPATAHLVVEALRRAFHDRARHLGDPDFVPVPLARLASRAHAAKLAQTIDPRAATPSESLAQQPASEGESTTHFSIVDAHGNRVAATLTINLLFGAGVVAAGTGVLLNNEMDDFALAPGVPNAFRLHGGEPNAIGPGKRPLSSMTPTFVEDERGVLVAGSAGGPRIVSQVLLAVLDYLHEKAVDPARIATAPRYHHQGWPDRVEVEPGAFPPAWRAALEAKGHEVRVAERRWGNMQLVFRSRASGRAIAASDPRGTGLAWY
jgi:gamma-glutamyltranspeptidase/glutathione hydrolase